MVEYGLFTTVTTLVCIIIALLGIVFKFIKSKNNEGFNKIREFLKNKYYYIFVIFIFITAFTSLYRLTDVPYGMHVDEAGMAYDAKNIANYGIDRYQNRLPVYLINFGGGQSAMYAYLAAILIKVFGYSKFIIRLPAVLLRIVALICICFTFNKDDKNRKIGLIFMLLHSMCPYFIIVSRWGLDCNLLVEFMTIAFCFLYNAIYFRKKRYFFLTGIFYGLSLYNYALSYVIIPIFLGISLLYLLITKRINFLEIIIIGIPLFFIALPLMLMILVNNGIINEIHSFITIPKLLNYRSAEISLNYAKENLYIIKSIFSYDKQTPALFYNSNPEFGTIYYNFIVFFAIGSIYSLYKIIIRIKDIIKKKEINESEKNDNLFNVIFFIWELTVLVLMLIIKEPNINKANAIYIPIFYFTSLGIYETIKNLKLTFIPIMLVLIVNFGLFTNYYFNRYNENITNKFLWASGYIDAIEYAKEHGKENCDVYIFSPWVEKAHIYILLNNGISPYDYRENDITISPQKITYHIDCAGEEFSDDDIIIVGMNDGLKESLLNSGYKVTEFGTEKAVFSVFEK